MTPAAKKKPAPDPVPEPVVEPVAENLDESLPVGDEPVGDEPQALPDDQTPLEPDADPAPTDDVPVVLDRQERSHDELTILACAAVEAAHMRSAGGAVHIAVALSEDGLPMMVDNAENLQVGIERARELVLIADADVAAAAMLDGQGAARAHIEGVYDGVIHAFDWQSWAAGVEPDVSDDE